MPEEIFDIIHRINYQINDAGLQSVTKELQEQTDRVGQLTQRMQRLQQIYDKTSSTEIQKRERIRNLIVQTQGALEKEGNAIEKTLLTNKSLNTELNKQLGLVGNLERQLQLLKTRRDAAFDVDSIKKYNAEIARTQSKLNTTRNAGLTPMQANGMGVGGFALGSAIGGGAVALVGRAASAIKDFAGDIVNVTNKYEKLNALLANTLGGKQAGAEAFKLLTDFAAETPFQLDELTASYLKLINRGIKPTREELTAFGDIAAAQGKSFDQFTEAVLDATTGEFERLKEFGIKASQSGNQVTLAFGNITKTVPKSALAIKNALLQIRNEAPGIAGAMKVISNTTEGALSNLADGFDRLKNNLGGGLGGAIKSTIGFVSDLVSSFNSFLEIPVEQKLEAERIEINSLVLALTDANITSDERSRIMTELNQKYPELLKNISLESLGQSGLLGFLNGVNLAYSEKIRLAGLDAVVAKKQEAAEKNAAELAERRLKLFTALQKGGFTNEEIASLGTNQQAIEQEIEKRLSATGAFGFNKNRAGLTNALEAVQGGFFGLSDDLLELQEQQTNYNNQLFDAKKLRDQEGKAIDQNNEKLKASLRLQIETLTKQRDAITGGRPQDFGLLRSIGVEKSLALGQLNKQIDEATGTLAGLTNATAKPSTATTSPAAALAAKKKKEETAAQRAERLLKQQQERDQVAFDKRLIELEKKYLADKKRIEDGEGSPGREEEDLRKLATQYASDVFYIEQGNYETRLATLKRFGKQKTEEYAKTGLEEIRNERKHLDDLQKLAAEAAAREKERREREEAERLAAIAAARKAFEDAAKEQLDSLEISSDRIQTKLFEALRDGKLSKTEKQPIADLLGIDVNSDVELFIDAVNKALQLRTLKAQLVIETNRQVAPGQTLDGLKESEKKIAQLEKQIAELQAQLTGGKKTAKQENSVVDYYDAISNAAAQAALAVIAAEQQMLDAQITTQEKRVEAARRIADRGNAELLQREEERLDKLNQKREANARQELIINQALTLSNSILAVTKAAAEGGIFAPATIAAAIGALVAGYSLVRSLTADAPGFRDGVIDLQGPGTTKSDSIHARLSKGESVMTAEATERYAPILEKMNKLSYKPSFLTYNPKTAENVMAARNSREMDYRKDFRTLADRMENIERAIIEKPVNDNIIDEKGWRNRQTKMLWREQRDRNI